MKNSCEVSPQKLIYWTNLVKITHMWRRWGTPPNFFLANLDDMTSSWDIEQNILKLVILGHFLPFYPSKAPKIRILKIEKNRFIWCTVSGVRSETGRIFCHSGPFFTFFPMETENQNFEKMKKYLKLLSFHKCIPKMAIIWCMVPHILSVADIIFCHFGPFFALTTWKIKILKK